MSGSRSAAPPSLSGSAAAIDAQAPAADLRRPAPEPAHEVFSDDDDGNYMDDEDYYDDVAADPPCNCESCRAKQAAARARARLEENRLIRQHREAALAAAAARGAASRSKLDDADIDEVLMFIEGKTASSAKAAKRARQKQQRQQENATTTTQEPQPLPLPQTQDDQQQQQKQQKQKKETEKPASIKTPVTAKPPPASSSTGHVGLSDESGTEDDPPAASASAAKAGKPAKSASVPAAAEPKKKKKKQKASGFLIGATLTESHVGTAQPVVAPAPAATTHVVGKVHVRHVDEVLPEDIDECLVCFEGFAGETGKRSPCKLVCGCFTVLHQVCAENWFVHVGANKCPMCFKLVNEIRLLKAPALPETVSPTGVAHKAATSTMRAPSQVNAPMASGQVQTTMLQETPGHPSVPSMPLGYASVPPMGTVHSTVPPMTAVHSQPMNGFLSTAPMAATAVRPRPPPAAIAAAKPAAAVPIIMPQTATRPPGFHHVAAPVVRSARPPVLAQQEAAWTPAASVYMPPKLKSDLEAHKSRVSATWTTEQCIDALLNGVPSVGTMRINGTQSHVPSYDHVSSIDHMAPSFTHPVPSFTHVDPPMTQSDPLSHPSHAIPSLLGVVLQNNSHVATEGSRHGPFAVDQTHVTGVRRALYDDVDDHEDSLDDDDSIEDDSIDSNDSNAASNSASDSESDDKADEEERIEDLLKAMDESMLMTYAVAQPNGDAFKELFSRYVPRLQPFLQTALQVDVDRQMPLVLNRIFAAAKGNVKQMGKAPSVFAWLMGIAKKQVEEHKKKR